MTKLVHVTTVPQTLYFFTGQIDFMKRRGFEVHAVSSPGNSFDKFCSREHISGHAVKMSRRITPLRDLIATLGIWQLLRRLQPTIVHAHTPKAGLVGMLSATAARVPVRIFELHGLPHVTASGLRQLLLKWATRIACRLSHRVLCVSHSICAVAISEKLTPQWKISVPAKGSVNGVDAAGLFNPAQLAPGCRQRVRSRHGIPTEAVVIGFVGRLVHDKGLVELSGAWNVLREEFPGLRCLLVGDPEPYDALPASVLAQFHNDPRIHREGWSDDLPEIYSAIDILVLPSYREGFPVVVLEAAAMGLPVVATRIPGCIDAVEEGITGLLVEPRDAQALAAAIRAYLIDPEMRKRHGEAGRRRTMLDFQPATIWQSREREYLRLLREKCLGCPEKPSDPVASVNWEGSTP